MTTALTQTITPELAAAAIAGLAKPPPAQAGAPSDLASLLAGIRAQVTQPPAPAAAVARREADNANVNGVA